MSYKPSSYVLKTQNNDGEMILKNTLTQSILKVRADDIDIVEKILETPNAFDESNSIFSELYKRGFIVNDYVDEAQIVDFLFNDAVYGNNVLELTIIPTNACNFDCVYCYQSEPYYYMSDETVNRIILFIKKHLHEYSGILISWFGGEPLLAKKIVGDMMNKIRAICLEEKKPFYSNMTTNGYEMDAKTFRELVVNHVRYFQITLDGPEKIHNIQRPHKTNSDSFERIVNNLLEIKNKFSRFSYKIAIRVNVSANMRPYINDFVDWLYNNFGNDNHFVIVWEFVRDWGGEKIEKNRDLIFEHKTSNHWLDVLSNKGFAINMGFEQTDLTVSLCIASKKNGFVINHDGQIYKCAMVVEDSELRSVNNIGFISSSGDLDLDKGKMVKWIGRNEIDKKCTVCHHYPECMGISCPLGNRILRQPNRCSELFIDDYEYLLRNRDVVKNIPYIK